MANDQGKLPLHTLSFTDSATCVCLFEKISNFWADEDLGCITVSLCL